MEECLICRSPNGPKKPRLCSHCGKAFCQRCIQEFYERPEPTSDSETEAESEETLYSRERNCPHCRGKQGLIHFINGDYIEDMAKELRTKDKKLKLAERKLRELVKPIADMCRPHKKQKLLHCETCNFSVCPSCEHSDHTLMFIEFKYNQKKLGWEELQKNRETLSSYNELEASYDRAVEKIREEGERKIKLVQMEMREALEATIRSKFHPSESFFKELGLFNEAVGEVNVERVETALNSQRLNRFVDMNTDIDELLQKSRKALEYTDRVKLQPPTVEVDNIFHPWVTAGINALGRIHGGGGEEVGASGRGVGGGGDSAVSSSERTEEGDAWAESYIVVNLRNESSIPSTSTSTRKRKSEMSLLP